MLYLFWLFNTLSDKTHDELNSTDFQYFLPMSLFLRQSLLAISEVVAAERGNAGDRISLGMPMDEVISSFESGVF